MKQELIDAISRSVSPLQGWCTVEKALAMADLIITKEPQIVVEIGVFGGRSLIPQALALKDNGKGIIYGIDPWRTSDALDGSLSAEDRKWWTENVDLHGIHAGCMQAIWNAGVEKQCIIIRSASQFVPRLFAGGIDVLHVDGCHSEESSVRDLKHYLPQMKFGSYVWFDDSSWPTTQKALGILRTWGKDIRKVNDCVLFQRKYDENWGKPKNESASKTQEGTERIGSSCPDETPAEVVHAV